MFEQFSDRARRVVAVAEQEARLFGHDHVGTEHLLLGVLVDGTSAAARVLTAAGATAEGARRKVAEAKPSSGSSTAGAAGDLPLTARGQRALDRAARFARQRRDVEVSTGHVLLGILDVEGTAGQVLRGLGVDVASLPAALEAAARDRGRDTPPAPASISAPVGHVEPICPKCGAPLAEGLSYRTVDANGAGGTRPFVIVSCGACGSAVGTTPA